MRVTAILAAIASCTVIFTVQSAHADALSPAELALSNSPTLLEDFAQIQEQKTATLQQESAKELQKEEKVETYKVQAGDSLIKIAEDHEIDWKRLFFKNTEIEHPDMLEVGTKLVIPDEDEELKEREIPVLEQPELEVQPQSVNSTTRPNTTPKKSVSRPAASPGNRYVYGYCTWYVKNRRPDLPNNLGNAISWASRAAAQGIATGRTPRVGAVGQSGNHVVYVESVNGDGTVTVSEMNWKGWNVQSRRVASASSFTYIY